MMYSSLSISGNFSSGHGVVPKTDVHIPIHNTTTLNCTDIPVPSFSDIKLLSTVRGVIIGVHKYGNEVYACLGEGINIDSPRVWPIKDSRNNTAYHFQGIEFMFMSYVGCDAYRYRIDRMFKNQIKEFTKYSKTHPEMFYSGVNRRGKNVTGMGCYARDSIPPAYGGVIVCEDFALEIAMEKAIKYGSCVKVESTKDLKVCGMKIFEANYVDAAGTYDSFSSYLKACENTVNEVADKIEAGHNCYSLEHLRRVCGIGSMYSFISGLIAGGVIMARRAWFNIRN